MDQKYTIDKLITLSEGELYESIAALLPAYQGTFYSPEAKTRLGKEWFEEQKNLLRTKLCSEWRITDKMNHKKFEDKITLASAIAAVLSPLGLVIPSIIIAVLIIKIGIRNFCNER